MPEIFVIFMVVFCGNGDPFVIPEDEVGGGIIVPVPVLAPATFCTKEELPPDVVFIHGFVYRCGIIFIQV